MLYFIRNLTNQAIKIGHSINGGEGRLGSLSTGSTADLTVILNWDAPDYLEAELHQRFVYCRIPSNNPKKEWFYSDPRLEGFIEGLQSAIKFSNVAHQKSPSSAGVSKSPENKRCKISANENTPNRITRLEETLKIMRANGSSLPLRMHDHKGTLTVWWASKAEAEEHSNKASIAWEEQNEVLVEHRVGRKGDLFTTGVAGPFDKLPWPLEPAEPELGIKCGGCFGEIQESLGGAGSYKYINDGEVIEGINCYGCYRAYHLKCAQKLTSYNADDPTNDAREFFWCTRCAENHEWEKSIGRMPPGQPFTDGLASRSTPQS